MVFRPTCARDGRNAEECTTRVERIEASSRDMVVLTLFVKIEIRDPMTPCYPIAVGIQFEFTSDKSNQSTQHIHVTCIQHVHLCL